jgi:uncharacterized lipoprotein YehR (DUF1307 family)
VIRINLLGGKFMKLMSKLIALLVAMIMVLSLAGCGAASTAGGEKASDKKIVLGFAQVGAESGWRTANTKSMKQLNRE